MIDVVLLLAGIALAVLIGTIVSTVLSDRADRRSPKRPAVWDDVEPGVAPDPVIGEGNKPKLPSDDRPS